MRLQPAEPALGGFETTVLVCGKKALLDQPQHLVDVAKILRIADRRLGLSVRCAPGDRAGQQLRHEIRLGTLELSAEQLPEEMVVAIPASVAVQRDHEQVRACERLQLRRRAARVQHGVAQRARHAREHRGTGQEAELVMRQPREDLGAKILGDEPVVSAKPDRARRPIPLRRERRQVETRAPALRTFGELGHLGMRQLQTSGTQELVRLGLVQTQLVVPDLDREAARPQRAQWQRGPASRREHQLRALRDMPGQLGDGGQAARVVQDVQVIQDQNRSLVHRREGCRYARHHDSLDPSAGRRQRVEHARVDLRDAVERGRDVRQQNDRVVVVLVDRPAPPAS